MSLPVVFVQRFRDPPARRRRNRLEAVLVAAALAFLSLAALGAALERMT